MPKPAKWKIDKLDHRESVGIQEMAVRLKAARQRVAIIVAQAARKKGLVISGRNREKLYNQIAAVYLQLDNGLKDWGKDLVEKGAIDWHDAAIRDIIGQTGIDPSNSVTKFSREYAQDVFARVSPENGRSLAAVLTDRMAAADIKALRQATVDVYREASLSGMTMREIGTAIQGRWDGIAGDLSAGFVDNAGRTWEDARYIQMLVRTTTARVARDSYLDTLVKNGDDLSIIQNVDGDACDICAAWDEVIVSITGSSQDYPSYNNALGAGWGHPNCVLGDTRVIAPEMRAALQSSYDGPIVELLTSSGRRLSVTPNHMLLTRGGFAFAQTLYEGDDIVCCPRVETPLGVVPDNDLSVPSAADVFGAAKEAAAITVVNVPSSTESLHGDGRFCNGEIDIVRTDGLLGHARNATLLQPGLQQTLRLVGTQPLSLPGAGTLQQLLASATDATDGGVSTARESLAFLRWRALHPGQHPLAPIPGGDSVLGEDASDHIARVTEALSQVFLRFSGAIAFEKITRIEIRHFTGHVFDLQCSSTMYLANGVLSSNCRCTMERVDETIDKDQIKQQADTDTPDFTRQDGETDSVYRSRVTENVAKYSEDFGTTS